MKKLILPFAAALVISAGCNQPAANPPTTDAKDGAPKGATTGTTEGGKTETSAKAPTRADIPDSVKTLAYQYAGLELDKLPMYEAKGGTLGLQTGSVENELIEVTDKSATFRQRYTGTLEFLGVTDVMATPDGVFSVKIGTTEINPPSRELTTTPKAGDKWVNKGQVEIGGSTIQESSYEVVGTKSIKVRAGTFDCLVVKTTVKAIQEGKPIQSQVVAYYAKKYGPVKLEMKSVNDGKEVVTTLEATKLP